LTLASLPAWSLTYLDHLHLQYAGQIGLISGGVGKQITRRYSLGLMYGHVPAGVAQGFTLETFAVRQTYSLLDWHRHRFYLGLNVFHVIGLRYETSQYGEPPRNYYSIGSVRGLLYLGWQSYLLREQKIAIYFESGINDIWIENTLANWPDQNPLRHLTMALGFKKEF
jgi:hypothetical protein